MNDVKKQRAAAVSSTKQPAESVKDLFTDDDDDLPLQIIPLPKKKAYAIEEEDEDEDNEEDGLNHTKEGEENNNIDLASFLLPLSYTSLIILLPATDCSYPYPDSMSGRSLQGPFPRTPKSEPHSVFKGVPRLNATRENDFGWDACRAQPLYGAQCRNQKIRSHEARRD
jgi:hypothetical protein